MIIEYFIDNNQQIFFGNSYFPCHFKYVLIRRSFYLTKFLYAEGYLSLVVIDKIFYRNYPNAVLKR